jgi:hypothetical protein
MEAHDRSAFVQLFRDAASLHKLARLFDAVSWASGDGIVAFWQHVPGT